MAVRAAAVIVDAFVVTILLGIPVSIFSGHASHGSGNVHFDLTGWAFVIWVALSIGYWTLCEAAWGRTIGKRLFSIRVVGPDGGNPSWTRSAIRNVLRLIDAFPYFLPYLVGFLVAKSNEERRRLGDKAGNTRVVARGD
jgi:uncharacterized RDD family membrane protein YckC